MRFRKLKVTAAGQKRIPLPFGFCRQMRSKSIWFFVILSITHFICAFKQIPCAAVSYETFAVYYGINHTCGFLPQPKGESPMQDQMSFAQLCASVLDGGAQPDFMINPENQQYFRGIWPQVIPPQYCPQCPVSGDGCSCVAYESAVRPDGESPFFTETCGDLPDMSDADPGTIGHMHGGCLPMPYPPAVACAPNSQYAVLIQRRMRASARS